MSNAVNRLHDLFRASTGHNQISSNRRLIDAALSEIADNEKVVRALRDANAKMCDHDRATLSNHDPRDGSARRDCPHCGVGWV